MKENRSSSISKADSDEKIGEFWDSHDFTDFDTDAPDTKFEIISTVPVQLELLNEIEAQAAKRGMNVETLMNQWLQQKLDEETAQVTVYSFLATSFSELDTCGQNRILTS
jgi:predicted DNA binding CopG/RHH family protein